MKLSTVRYVWQSATEKLRLHWRKNHVPYEYLGCPANPQLKSCGSIEGLWKIDGDKPVQIAIRNWKVAAPLKVKIIALANNIKCNPQLKSCGSIEGKSLGIGHNNNYTNPQLKSCGSIEGYHMPVQEPFPYHNPQLKSCGSIEGYHMPVQEPFPYHNPQLKSCGSIEGTCVFGGLTDTRAIRNWKVAAPLKAQIQALRLLVLPSIHNWKVAAPLKAHTSSRHVMSTPCSPQLKNYCIENIKLRITNKKHKNVYGEIFIISLNYNVKVKTW